MSTPAPGSATDAASGAVGELLEALSGVLDAEYEALTRRDVDGLENLLERKSAIVTALEARTARIAAGVEPAPDPAELSALAGRCIERNRTNGGAITLNRELVTTLLDTLYGVSRAERTYGAAGELRGPDAVRSVGRA